MKGIFICIVIFFAIVGFFFVRNSNSKDVEKASEEALIIAHRGAVDQFNENTIEAYEQSIKDGTDWIEIDIRITRDGVLVPIYDVDIDRTTMGTGIVKDLSWHELSQMMWYIQRSY